MMKVPFHKSNTLSPYNVSSEAIANEGIFAESENLRWSRAQPVCIRTRANGGCKMLSLTKLNHRWMRFASAFLCCGHKMTCEPLDKQSVFECIETNWSGQAINLQSFAAAAHSCNRRSAVIRIGKRDMLSLAICFTQASYMCGIYAKQTAAM